MGRVSKYPEELRERAVRMVAEVRLVVEPENLHLCPFLCLGGGSGSLILVSCRLARWWLRSVRCWAARINCSAIHRPPDKARPRAR